MPLRQVQHKHIISLCAWVPELSRSNILLYPVELNTHTHKVTQNNILRPASKCRPCFDQVTQVWFKIRHLIGVVYFRPNNPLKRNYYKIKPLMTFNPLLRDFYCWYSLKNQVNTEVTKIVQVMTLRSASKASWFSQNDVSFKYLKPGVFTAKTVQFDVTRFAFVKTVNPQLISVTDLACVCTLLMQLSDKIWHGVD